MEDVTDRFVQRFDRFGEQRYETIKRRCLREALLWEDPQFPATTESLWETPPTGIKNEEITWLRFDPVAISLWPASPILGAI